MQKLHKHSGKRVPVEITDTLSYGTPEYMSALLQLQVSSIPSCSRHVVRQKYWLHNSLASTDRHAAERTHGV